MPAGVTGARLKVKRAGKHIRELDRKVNAFVERHAKKSRSEDDPDDLNYVIYTLPPNPAPPLTFGPVFADIVNNLRSALEHIAWNLATLHLENTAGRRKPRKPHPQWTSFPIIRSFSNWDVCDFWSRVYDMPPEAIPDIVEFQPAHSSNPDAHYFAVLDDLWNRDKHRVHVPLPGRQYIPAIEGLGEVRVEVLEDHSRRIRLPKWCDPKRTLEPKLRMDVMFEVPKTGDRFSLAEMRMVYDLFSQKVIPRFSRFLPELRGPIERLHGKIEL